jgi:hypothetical protein
MGAGAIFFALPAHLLEEEDMQDLLSRAMTFIREGLIARTQAVGIWHTRDEQHQTWRREPKI